MSGAEVIRAATAPGRALQWPALLGLLESAIYGGRVDSAQDMRVLRTYLARFFSKRAADGQARRSTRALRRIPSQLATVSPPARVTARSQPPHPAG